LRKLQSFLALRLHPYTNTGVQNDTRVYGPCLRAVNTGVQCGPCSLAPDHTVNTGREYLAPVFTGRVGKQQCTTMLFADTARGHGCSVHTTEHPYPPAVSAKSIVVHCCLPTRPVNMVPGTHGPCSQCGPAPVNTARIGHPCSRLMMMKRPVNTGSMY